MKLIKLSGTHYIIVDDSEIKVGDYKWHHVTGIRKALVDGNYTNQFKITHSTQSELLGDGWMQSVKPLLLSEVEEAVNGYSVEKMAADNWDSQDMKYKDISEPWDFSFGYHQGFSAAMELTKDKLFTVEDVMVAIKMAKEVKPYIYKEEGEEGEPLFDLPKYSDTEIIQSLLPKTEWDIELIDGKIKLI